MEHALVVAIIHGSCLEAVEKRLQAMGVLGITVTKVKSYEEYADFLSRDHLVEQVKIEAFAPRHQAQLIATAIVEAAFIGTPSDEVVAILPVETLFGGRSQPSAG